MAVLIRASLLTDALPTFSAPSLLSSLLTTVSPAITVLTVAFCKQLLSHFQAPVIPLEII